MPRRYSAPSEEMAEVQARDIEAQERAREAREEEERKEAEKPPVKPKPPEPPTYPPPREEMAEIALREVPPPVAPTKPDELGGQVATVDGVGTYIAGSTMREMGFHTTKEYIKAQRQGASLGIHEGREIPADTVIFTDKAGKPIARYTQHQMANTLGADYINPFIKQEKYRIPVTDYRGKEVLLTPKQVEKLRKAKTDRARFKLYKDYGVIKKGAVFTTAAMVKVARKKVALSKFEQQQWKKRHTKLKDGWIAKVDLAKAKKDSPEVYRLLTTEGFGAADAYITKQRVAYEKNKFAISMLESYTDKEGGVDGAKYLRDNPKDTNTLKNAGFDKTIIADWQVYNAKLPPIVRWSAEIEIQSPAFKRRVEELLIARPHFTQLDAERIARAEFKAKGIALKKSPDLPQQIKLANAHYETLTPAEKAEYKREWKELPLTAAEMLIPGVYVARNWTTLSTKDKVINIGIDVASILLGVGIFKLGGATARLLSSANKQIRVATKVARQAGKVGRELDEATKVFNAYQKVGKMGSPLWIKHINKIEKLRQASMKADKSFLNMLENLDAISPKQLKLLETRSGLKGIPKAIKDITKTQKKVDKAWKTLE